jgi:hypothetical protein
MVFHGLVDHAWDYLITKLSFIKKGNLTTLTKDKLSQPHIFNGVQRLITFNDVQDQILKKQFLNKVWIFAWHSEVEKINNRGYKWLFQHLINLMSISYYGSSSSSCVVLLRHYRMFKSHMLTHGSCAKVFVVHNKSFPILGRSPSNNSYWMLWHTTHLIYSNLKQSTIIVWSLNF